MSGGWGVQLNTERSMITIGVLSIDTKSWTIGNWVSRRIHSIGTFKLSKSFQELRAKEIMGDGVSVSKMIEWSVFGKDRNLF